MHKNIHQNVRHEPPFTHYICNVFFLDFFVHKMFHYSNVNKMTGLNYGQLNNIFNVGPLYYVFCPTPVLNYSLKRMYDYKSNSLTRALWTQNIVN